MTTNAYRTSPSARPKGKTIRVQRMELIFNEWNRRYAEKPEEFISSLNDDGTARMDYGELCVLYFDRIAEDMDDKGLLPRP